MGEEQIPTDGHSSGQPAAAQPGGEQGEQPGGGQPADEHPGGGAGRGVWLGVAGALLVVVVLGVVSVVGARKTTADPATAGPSIAQARLAAAHRVPGDPLALGKPDAPVTMVVWADFQCPYCKAFTEDSATALIKQYVDTGKMRLEWRDFAFLGPESTAAAVAARAAGRQGKFWAYHDKLYAEQHPENSGALTSAYLLDLARRLGLDPIRFSADVADPALARQVAADEAEGEKLGINGTPGFLINGALSNGADPLPEYQRTIDAALAHPAPIG
jgi:protein-disulfide isomerase